MLQDISVAYFSPTGGTKRAALGLSEGIAEHIREIDMSVSDAPAHAFGKDDVVLFASPVFGGRIPAYMVEKLKICQGNNAMAITAVVYGNRGYDDALLEFNDLVKARGFRILASSAVVAEHSVARAIAAGRPNEQDRLELREYGKGILGKLQGGEIDADVVVPGKRPYVEWKPIPVVPAVSASCNNCGVCVEKCPVQAIPQEDARTTDPSKCMLCMRCVALCALQARTLPAQVQGAMEQRLAPLKNVRRENELFL